MYIKVLSVTSGARGNAARGNLSKYGMKRMLETLVVSREDGQIKHPQKFEKKHKYAETSGEAAIWRKCDVGLQIINQISAIWKRVKLEADTW